MHFYTPLQVNHTQSKNLGSWNKYWDKKILINQKTDPKSDNCYLLDDIVFHEQLLLIP